MYDVCRGGLRARSGQKPWLHRKSQRRSSLLANSLFAELPPHPKSESLLLGAVPGSETILDGMDVISGQLLGSPEVFKRL